MSTTTVPLYKQFFPTFGDLDVVVPFGFEDQSNEHDDCPCFALSKEDGDTALTLFIDFKDEKDRAEKNPCRFVVYDNAADGLTTDDWEEVLAFVGARRPRIVYFPGFETEDEHIINPTCCDPRGMACDPSRYGFEVSGTGGGCTAWRKKLPDGTEVLLTDEGGTSNELGEFGAAFILGFYDVDGSELGIWVFEVGVAYNSPEDAEEGDGTPKSIAHA